MLYRLLDKVERHHVWRAICIMIILELVAWVYLLVRLFNAV